MYRSLQIFHITGAFFQAAMKGKKLPYSVRLMAAEAAPPSLHCHCCTLGCVIGASYSHQAK